MARNTSGLSLGAFKVIIYEPALSKLMRPGETVDDMGKYISRLIVAYAIREAPVSGLKTPWGTNPASEHLSTKHVRRGRLNAGPRAFQYGVANTASYARTVHEGHAGLIFASGGKPKARGHLWANAHELDFIRGVDLDIVPLGHYVRGQDANPWLRRAGMLAAKQGSHNFGIIARGRGR